MQLQISSGGDLCMNKKIEKLVANLYESILEPSSRNDTLDELGKLLDAPTCVQNIIRIDDQSGLGETQLTVSRNVDPDKANAYREYYHTIDPYLERLKNLRQPCVVTYQDMLRFEELEKTEYYHDFVKGHDIYWGLAAILELGTSGTSYFTAMRPRRTPDFGLRERTILQQIAPHLNTCIRLQRHLTGVEAVGRTLEGLLGQLAFGIILLDGASRILFLNVEAEKVVRAGTSLTVKNNKLRATSFLVLKPHHEVP